MTCTHPTRSQGSGAMSPLVINGESLIQRSNPIHTQCKLPMPMISEIVHHTYIVNELCVVHLVRARRMGILQSAKTHSFRCPCRASCLYSGRWCLNDYVYPCSSSSLPGCLTSWHPSTLPAPRLTKKLFVAHVEILQWPGSMFVSANRLFGVVIRMAMDMDVSY